MPPSFITMNLIAHQAIFTGAQARFGHIFAILGAIFTAFALSACSTPQPPMPKAVYDFGVSADPVAGNPTQPRRPTLALPEIDAGNGLDSPALLYRLQYADGQQLRPYAQARWSVPPAQLVRTRLRDALARSGSVLPSEGVAQWSLRVELEEFSQVFSSPQVSQGHLRLRVSLFKTDPLKGEQLVAQTLLTARADAPSQDAAGGVRALTAATDDAVSQTERWLATRVLP
jgi:cholesterol transport system auxiliary component